MVVGGTVTLAGALDLAAAPALVAMARHFGTSAESQLFSQIVMTLPAAMLVIAASVYFFVVNKKPAEPPVVINEPESNTGITPEINQIVKMIGMKQEELKTLAAGQPELYRQFSNDLDQLDSSYNALKSELNETPNQELLLEAMIQNLQLQLNVLNQQLNIINQIKQSKKYSHEKKDQSI